MRDKFKSKYLTLIICACVSFFITFFASDIILSKLHMYEFKDEPATIRIKVLDESNKHSYGKEMRIVSLTINGEQLDLKDYANDDWIWHEEWGYILYQEGNSVFEVKLDRPLHSLQMEYVEQEGSGNAVVFCNNEEACQLNMYRKKWSNEILTLSYLSENGKLFWKCDLFLFIVLLSFIIVKMASVLLNPPPKLKGVKSNLTMFDLAKGIGIIGIIFGHTKGLVYGGLDVSGLKLEMVSSIIGLFFLYGLLPMFFIASGYGFRISETKTTCKKQLYFLVKPYAIVTLATVLVSLLRFFIDSEYKLEEFLGTILPFLFANAHECSIGSIAIKSIGPMWFGFSLAIAWIVLNSILNVKNQRLRNIMLISIPMVGYFFSKFDLSYYSLTQTLFVVLLIFVGYLLREKKIFIKESNKTIFAYCLGGILFVALAIYNGNNISIVWNKMGKNYFIMMILCMISGTIILRAFLVLNQYAIGKFKWLKEIGRNTYIIFYIHSFEDIAIPWKKVVNFLPEGKFLSFIILVSLRCLLIYVIYKMIEIIKKYKTKRRV